MSSEEMTVLRQLVLHKVGHIHYRLALNCHYVTTGFGIVDKMKCTSLCVCFRMIKSTTGLPRPRKEDLVYDEREDKKSNNTERDDPLPGKIHTIIVYVT